MTIHFTGIKGVGMTALAQVLQDQGHEVQGSDTKDWQITDPVLAKRGIKVFDRFTPRNISIIENSRWKPVIDKLIYTGAHHGAQNVEVKWAASRDISVSNYAKALGEVFSDKKQVCVCGVGGKTTTSAMLATILYASPPVISSESSSREIQRSDQNQDAGARSLDFGTHRLAHPFARDDKKASGMTGVSWIVGTSEIASLPASGYWGQGKWAVIESDEYVADPQADKTPKFMYLNPKIIICTNIHHDHPDVYPTEEDTVQAYVRFFEILPKDGLLLLSSQAYQKASDAQIFRKMRRGRVSNNGISIYDEDKNLKKLVEEAIAVPGDYNVKNAMAAVIAAEYIGIPRETALEALKKYTGSKRRFELIANVGGVMLYDDYAHHPDEISGLLSAAREKFPDSRIRFVFQPHTFSRTKVLLSEFARSLKDADEAILFPIFASARESVDPTVSSELLASEIVKLGGNAVYLPTKQKLIQYLCQTVKPPEVIFTVGAGNLYDIHKDLVDCLSKTRETAS